MPCLELVSWQLRHLRRPKNGVTCLIGLIGIKAHAPEVIKEEEKFHGDGFSLFYKTDMKHHLFSSSRQFRKCIIWPWKVNFKIWSQVRPGQGQVMIQVGQYAYLPKHLDEPSRLAPFARLYLHPVTSYWRKTDYDHRWPSRDHIGCTYAAESWHSWTFIS